MTLLERQKLSFLARVYTAVLCHLCLCPGDESFLEVVMRPVCPLGHRLWPLHSVDCGCSSFPNLVLLCALSWLPGMYVGHRALRYPGQKEPFQDGGACAAVKSRAFRSCPTPSGLLVTSQAFLRDPGFCFPFGNNLASRTLAHVAKSVFC